MACIPEWIETTPAMWTEETRARYDRRDLRYPSDLRDEEWAVLDPLLPADSKVGRPRKHSRREIMNGVRYVLRYGIPWDAMPKDLPPWSTCYDYWRMLGDAGRLEQINHLLVMDDREKAGRAASPTLAILDAQSVRCDAPKGPRGYDAGKKINGRKRHLAVDGGGRLLAAAVTTADVQDQDAGLPLAGRVAAVCPWVQTFVADGGYKRRFVEGVRDALDRAVEIVKRSEATRGFHVLPKRWKVEQSIGVLTQSRRLRCDYETLMHVSLGMLTTASIMRLVSSIARAG